MKKILVMVFLTIVLSLGAFAENGIIKSLNGTVELKAAGAAAFVPAKVGDSVAQNTIVSTGFKSTAIITVGSSTITVRPLTRLTLSEISTIQETEKINVHLQTGRVQVDVKPPAGSRTTFAIKSPTATASVRGTAFDFDTHNLLVREGTVAFTGTSGALMLIPAGTESHVSNASGNRATDPVVLSKSDLLPLPPPGAGAAPAKNPIPASSVPFSIGFDFNSGQ